MLTCSNFCTWKVVAAGNRKKKREKQDQLREKKNLIPSSDPMEKRPLVKNGMGFLDSLTKLKVLKSQLALRFPTKKRIVPKPLLGWKDIAITPRISWQQTAIKVNFLRAIFLELNQLIPRSRIPLIFHTGHEIMTPRRQKPKLSCTKIPKGKNPPKKWPFFATHF